MTPSSRPRDDGPKNRVPSKTLRRVWNYLKIPVVGASIVALLNPIFLQLVSGSLSKTTLVLVLLLEGGAGLIVGSAIALSSTPSISKAGEIVFERAPWSREGERNAERVAGKWMIASALLILAGFVLSAT
jgi:hypothetical protein